MADLTALTRSGVRTIEQSEALDAIAQKLEPFVQRLTASNAVKRTLSGSQLGHRLHPLLTDIPIGSWTSASLLDVIAWRSGEASARRLTAIGVISAIPTAVTGLSDWSDLHGEAKRVGVVHLISNSIAIGFEFGSWRARARGRHLRGALLGLGGIAVATVGGYLGGHLVFAQRAGVDVEVPLVDGDDWHDVGAYDDLVPDQPIGVDIGDARVVVVRHQTEVFALAATCTHAGGPLDEGTIVEGAIKCPWHGSEFCLRDGAVERGPATTPEPTYVTRIRAGRVEIATQDAKFGSAPRTMSARPLGSSQSS
jgi:nitrite reductase/ring-hydroxylating ferredoxin subunit/uncharacterized membrane protein